MVRSDGIEFWSVRGLAPVLGYSKWKNFSKAINRAKLAYKHSGLEITDRFPDIKKTIKMPKRVEKEVVDY